ncbi:MULTISPECIES: hypothetical protein [unclassified Streptomyces]
MIAHHAPVAISERARSTGIALASIADDNHIGMSAFHAEDTAPRAVRNP